MKTLNIAFFTTAVVLLSSTAMANDTYKNVHQQNFSKRPYHQPLPESAYQKAAEFEGATLVRDELNADESAAEKHLQVQRLNMLSKRPY